MRRLDAHGKLLTLLFGVLLTSSSLLLLAGCGGGLLPAQQAQTTMPFHTYDQVVESFEQIVPGMTRAEDLPGLGFDARNSNADVLSYLPGEHRSEIIQRVASLETVQPSAMEELEAIMKKQFSTNSSAKSSSFGGIKAAAKIMNFVKVDLESTIMGGLERLDGDLKLKIQDNMFVFENLSAVDNRSIQTLMRAVESEMLMVALKGAPDTVKNKFLDNMSGRARLMFVDEMEARGPLRMADVEEAQKQVIRIARKLSDAGEMMLAGRGDDFV